MYYSAQVYMYCGRNSQFEMKKYPHAHGEDLDNQNFADGGRLDGGIKYVDSLLLLWQRGENTIHICKLCLHFTAKRNATRKDSERLGLYKVQTHVVAIYLYLYAYLMAFVLYVFMFMCTFIYIHFVAGILCAVLASQNWY